MKIPNSGIWLLAIIFFLSFVGCRLQSSSPEREAEGNILAGLANDSILLDGLVDVAYNEVMIPLYYDACRTDERTDNLYNPTSSAVFDSGYTGDWNQAATIKLCDRLITMIDTNAHLCVAGRNRLHAELLFLKSMVYYALVQRYGAIIIDSTSTVDNFFYPRERRGSLSGCYRYVIEMLQNCSSGLPDIRNPLRAGKATAQAMIMRVALQAAAYVPEEREAYLGLVVQSGKSIGENEDYTMVPDYEGLFNDFSKSSNSPEVILGIYRPRAYTTFRQTLMQDLVVNQSNPKMKAGYGPPLNDAFDGWSKRYPTQNLVDAYLAIDVDGSARKWNETSRYQSFKAGQGYASDVLYAGRDKRFYASIVYDSSKYFNSVVLTRDSGNLSIHARRDNNALTPTGYYVRKLLYETQKIWYVDGTRHFVPVLRLGEVYLNLAEAFLLKNNRNAAVSFINKTRTIHGGLPPLDTVLSLPMLWEAYKDERRVELFFENDRYWSLLRWAKFNQQSTITALEKPVDAINISANGKFFKIVPVPDAGSRKGMLAAKLFFIPLPEASEPK